MSEAFAASFQLMAPVASIACLRKMGTVAAVGVSSNRGQSWDTIYDVGAGLGLTNIAFPAATAGDDGRAAVAFYASKGGAGDSSADTYTGVWHLYVAHTFDAGAHWTTTDVTPSMPMQRMGLLRGGGPTALRVVIGERAVA